MQNTIHMSGTIHNPSAMVQAMALCQEVDMQNFAAIPGFYTKGCPLVKSNLICPSDKLG